MVLPVEVSRRRSSGWRRVDGSRAVSCPAARRTTKRGPRPAAQRKVAVVPRPAARRAIVVARRRRERNTVPISSAVCVPTSLVSRSIAGADEALQPMAGLAPSKPSVLSRSRQAAPQRLLASWLRTWRGAWMARRRAGRRHPSVLPPSQARALVCLPVASRHRRRRRRARRRRPRRSARRAATTPARSTRRGGGAAKADARGRAETVFAMRAGPVFVVTENGRVFMPQTSAEPALVSRRKVFRRPLGTYADEPFTFYVGAWAGDVWHGGGVLKFANGDVYEGAFVRGERHGTGKMTREARAERASIGPWRSFNEGRYSHADAAKLIERGLRLFESCFYVGTRRTAASTGASGPTTCATARARRSSPTGPTTRASTTGASASSRGSTSFSRARRARRAGPRRGRAAGRRRGGFDFKE